MTDTSALRASIEQRDRTPLIDLKGSLLVDSGPHGAFCGLQR